MTATSLVSRRVAAFGALAVIILLLLGQTGFLYMELIEFDMQSGNRRDRMVFAGVTLSERITQTEMSTHLTSAGMDRDTPQWVKVHVCLYRWPNLCQVKYMFITYPYSDVFAQFELLKLYWNECRISEEGRKKNVAEYMAIWRADGNTRRTRQMLLSSKGKPK